MRPRYVLVRPWLRLATGLAIAVAIAAQCQRLSSDGAFKPVNVFSFFTIQSNLLALFVLLGLEFRPDTAVFRLMRAIRPGVVLHMAMTGVVYAVLLAPAAAREAHPEATSRRRLIRALSTSMERVRNRTT